MDEVCAIARRPTLCISLSATQSEKQSEESAYMHVDRLSDAPEAADPARTSSLVRLLFVLVRSR